MKLKELPNTVVHCKTRKEYDQLMKMYEEAGWRWCSGNLPTANSWDSRSDSYGRILIRVQDGFSQPVYDESSRCEISFSDFLREQGIPAKKEVHSLLRTYTVYEHDNCPVKLWCRGEEVKARNGRKVKTYTVTGDLDQWASAFFDGYLAAQ